jgi:hypothetical protein
MLPTIAHLRLGAPTRLGRAWRGVAGLGMARRGKARFLINAPTTTHADT